METLTKLKTLGEGAKYDICASTSSRVNKLRNPSIGQVMPRGLCHSFTPDGRCISLFKVLLTNYCERDCLYCPNRADRDVLRAKFKAEELAKLFINFYRRNYVEGLFVSSGIWNSTSYTMGEIIKVAEILRSHYRFGGYMHLKILPGASNSEVEKATKLANRLSLNMEAPSAFHLSKLSQTKKFDSEIISGIEKISSFITEHQEVSHTTQYIVGASNESDQEILQSVSMLYQNYHLKRAYFSAFQPIADTPLAHQFSTPLIRENRLYQSDFLLRIYNFKLNDLVFDSSGNLDQTIDPKLAYAFHHPEMFPQEINKAPYNLLLKVPGIGPGSANKIIQLRRQHRFTDPRELKNTGMVLKRALSFITINGKFYGYQPILTRPKREVYEQLSLWGDKNDLVFSNTNFNS